MIKQVNINEVLTNPNNPRTIKDDKFKKLVKSIKEFPQMLEKRAIVVDEAMMVLGGNMRLKACKDAGIKMVWVDVAEGWTEEQKKEFIVKDNVGFGEWDWDAIANEWEEDKLDDWGLDVWQPEDDVDYSILDDDDLTDQLKEMTEGVRKAIQIEFEAEHYDEAADLVRFWRSKDAYVGKMILDFLKSEKEKL
mgnify:CR=1 FL=1|tara:strand:+ start:2430 stop:3005 length:576 start_codon:yes stop_codon:yes gene_type:complete